MEGWESFIAKDERRRCPDGYHRDEETGQCVDENGNVYQEQEEPITDESAEEQTEEGQTDDTREEPTQEEQSTEEGGQKDGEEPAEEDKDKDLKQGISIDAINSRSERAKAWVEKNIGSWGKLTPHSSNGKVFKYFTIVLPIMAAVRGVLESSAFIKSIIETHRRNKDLDRKKAEIYAAYNKGIQNVTDALGIDNPETHQWTKEDISNMHKATSERIDELLKTPAIKKILDEKVQNNTVKPETLQCPEYAELKAMMDIMKRHDDYLLKKYDEAKARKIAIDEATVKEALLAKEAEEKAKAAKLEAYRRARAQNEGTADAVELRHVFNPKTGATTLEQ